MKNPLLLLICALSLCFSSCDYNGNKQNVTLEKQWVYIELVTESKIDTSDYFYYGQIKKSLINEIQSNEEKKGL